MYKYMLNIKLIVHLIVIAINKPLVAWGQPHLVHLPNDHVEELFIGCFLQYPCVFLVIG
jgi:hypothetical protein